MNHYLQSALNGAKDVNLPEIRKAAFQKLNEHFSSGQLSAAQEKRKATAITELQVAIQEYFQYKSSIVEPQIGNSQNGVTDFPKNKSKREDVFAETPQNIVETLQNVELKPIETLQESKKSKLTYWNKYIVYLMGSVLILAAFISSYNLLGAMEAILAPCHEAMSKEYNTFYISTSWVVVLIFEVMKIGSVISEQYFVHAKIVLQKFVKMLLNGLRVVLFILSVTTIFAITSYSLVSHKSVTIAADADALVKQNIQQLEQEFNKARKQLDVDLEQKTSAINTKASTEVKQKIIQTSQHDRDNAIALLTSAHEKKINELRKQNKYHIVKNHKNPLILGLEDFFHTIRHPILYNWIAYFFAAGFAFALEACIYIAAFFWSKALFKA